MIIERKYDLVPVDMTQFSHNHMLSGHKVFRIKARRDLGLSVRAGDLGGFVSGDFNLSHEGTCWIYDDAIVVNNAVVLDSAMVKNSAYICGMANPQDSNKLRIKDHAVVSGHASIYDSVQVGGNAKVEGQAYITRNVMIDGESRVSGNATIFDTVRITGNALVSGAVSLRDNTLVTGTAQLRGSLNVSGGNIEISGGRFSNDARIGAGAKITCDEDFIAFCGVGSESGTLAAYLNDLGEIRLTRGCFEGNIKRFMKMLAERHKKNSNVQLEYKMLIGYIKTRFGNTHQEDSLNGEKIYKRKGWW